MPISLKRASAHVADWRAKLPSRTWWPNHLFFAAHVTSAAKILASGRLACRRDLAGMIDHDTANQDALGANPDAHKYARLYFRPRTHFHLRTEGIKLLTDAYRLPCHMSVPIMFVFRFEKVVTREGVGFCDRKMAHVGIQPGFDETYFDAIDFTKVYHDRGISDPFQRAEINDRRMAEVLVPDYLPLDHTLEAIVCRTAFDETTLLNMLGDDAAKWHKKIRASTKPAEMFFCWGAYITELQLVEGALTLKVKSAQDYKPGQTVKFNIVQHRRHEGPMVWRYEKEISNNPLLIKGWDAAHTDDWLIEIEDALAFKGKVPQAPKTVVAV